MIKIDQPIIAQTIVTKLEGDPPQAAFGHRPAVLIGATGVAAPPDGANIYITLNHQEGRPREVFTNSVDTSHFPQMTAITRLMSVALKHGVPLEALTKELRVVADPNGGYWKKARFYPSLIAEIGGRIEELAGIEQPPAKAEAKVAETPQGSYCKVCGETAVVKVDGCDTCKACGDSKCS
jgi:ribonucleoside-diphosphate reductase alpha chain